jgi:3-oxoacyl-[acyl-carrier-protein] synthase II
VGSGAIVTAPKSAIGHMFGAAGAVEAILTVRALETGIVPPTLNLEHQDPAIDLDVVAGAARTATVRAALNNSFGFGGQNASLVFTAV